MVQINKNLFGAFIILLIVSVLFSIYAFMKKGKSVAPITLVMYNKVFNYESENNYTKEQFWDNYPYWTLLSREQPIDTSIELQNEDGIIVPLSTIINQNGTLFFRYNNEVMHDSLTDSVLEYIERLKYPVIILANSISSKTLKNTKCYGNLRNFIFVTDRNLFEIDKSSLSYFFSLAPKYKSSNIFVPRIEIPEVSMKYLIFMKNNIKE